MFTPRGKNKFRAQLTQADPAVSMDFGEVAVEPLVVVAGLLEGAQLAQLPGAHLAAAAPVQQKAGACRALEGLGRAPARV